jgi:AraC-like DNA-binding protein
MLDAVRVRSAVYCRSQLGAPWGFRVAGSPQAKFHLVLSGSATLSIDVGDEVVLQGGDLALLSRGSGHVMRDRRRSRVRRLDEILEDHPVDASGTMHYGGGGARTVLVCGEFETEATDGLLAWLPPILVLDTSTNGLGRWLDPMIDLLRGERRPKLGDAAIVARVADVFLTDVLRHYLANSSGSFPTSGSPAITDPIVVEAMAVMHQRSNEPWTIAVLARQVGVSRSSFVARFHAAVGAAPIAYLTRLRLGRAAGALAASSRPVVEIARAAGYDNESSFSKAFARHYGKPPGRYRSEHRRVFDQTRYLQ